MSRLWAVSTRPGVIRLVAVVVFALMAVCARPPEEGAAWRTAFVLLSFAGFGVLAVAWRSNVLSSKEVVLTAVLFRLVVFPLPPVLSDDGYRYVWDGVVQVQAGQNPYRFTPADDALAGMHDEVLFGALNSPDYHSVYPPLSQAIFALGGLAYPLGWMASWYLIKLVLVMAEVGGLVLLCRMVSPRALLLYAWNPLVVIECAGQAHTEALAAPLLILTLWAARQGRGALGGGALAAAGWVKLSPFLLLPFLVRRYGLRAGIVAGGIGLVFALPYAAPYVVEHVRGSLDLYVRSFEFNAGIYYALKGVLWAGTGTDWSKQLGPALQIGFLIATCGVYLLDLRQKMTLATAFSVVLGLFLVFTTTVHPWYLVLLLAVLPLLPERMPWRLYHAAWMWLSAFSMATYWAYVGPSWGATAAVSVGWTGAVGLLAATGVGVALPGILRRRARRKWAWISGHLGDGFLLRDVLDLGAGDGYVGERIAAETDASVVLADVVDFNNTSLPFHRYDGTTLPFDEGGFDLTVLSYVLHHASSPEAVLQEARRVTRGRVAVLESVAVHPLQRRLFVWVDRAANLLRSGGKMGGQDRRLDVRTDAHWRRTFRETGLRVVTTDGRGLCIHRERLYLLEPLL